MWSTFSGTRHCLMSSPTFSSVSYPTEYLKPLPTTPSQTTSYIFPTFPTTFLLYSNDNKANAWLCRKWKDSYHLFTVMNKYWLGWINNCYLLACPRKMCWEALKGRKDKNIIEALWKTGFTKLLRQLWEPCNNNFLQIVLYDKYNIELLRESG